MKKILLLLFSFLFIMPFVNANSIEKISMDIYLNEDGSAHVKEVWDTYSNDKTEWYKPYQNIGNSKFTNFVVYKDGTKFNYVSSWDINGSFNDKKYKNGINYTDEGIELCMGISEYGKSIYTMQYDVTNFIANLNDSQMFYWTLIPNNMNPYPSNVYIKVHSFYQFPDNLDVWGYGILGAPTYVYDGYIEMSTENFTEDGYMVMLIKFPSNTFNTTNNYNHDFNYYYKMAKNGSTKYDSKNNFSIVKTIKSIISFIISMIFPIAVIGIVIASSSKNNFYKRSKKSVNKDQPMFRDIPCDKNIFKAYYISNLYGLTKKETDFFGAVLLNWLRKDMIELKKGETGLLIKKESVSITFKNVVCENSLEKELYDMLISASNDGSLEQNEFEKYCKNHYQKVLDWFNRVQKNECETLINENIIQVDEKKVLGVFKHKEYQENASVLEDANKLYGLKKYLIEFSNMKDKEAIEVKLWDYYLIYAQIFGIAKKVAEQFKKLYPEVIEGYGYDFDTIIFLDSFSSSSISAASVAQSRAESYSSGGGGFSSGGGGGGSFGGGSGGGGSR